MASGNTINTVTPRVTLKFDQSAIGQDIAVVLFVFLHFLVLQNLSLLDLKIMEVEG